MHGTKESANNRRIVLMTERTSFASNRNTTIQTRDISITVSSVVIVAIIATVVTMITVVNKRTVVYVVTIET